MSKQEQRELIRRECESRGIDIYQRGLAYCLVGLGVDLKVIDLADVTLDALSVYQPLHRPGKG